MICFILFCVYWLSLFVELVSIHTLRDSREMKKSGTLKALSKKQERLLGALFILQASIIASQLIIGPTVDGFSVGYTVLLVFGAELMGFGFGALATMTSIMRLVHTYKQRLQPEQDREPFENDSASDMVLSRPRLSTQQRNRRNFCVLAAIDVIIGIVLAAFYYFAQEYSRRILLIVLAVYVLAVVPLSALILLLIQRRKAGS